MVSQYFLLADFFFQLAGHMKTLLCPAAYCKNIITFIIQPAIKFPSVEFKDEFYLRSVYQ